MTNPLKAIFDIRRGERIFSLSMAAYFFLVITSFWILKPIKKTLFIRHYDKGGFDLLGWTMTASQAELLAKVANMVVAFGAVFAFTLLARRLRRQALAYAFGAFFLACFAAFAAALGNPSPGTVWAFYLFGDLYSTLMVATFFAFLSDSVSPEAARRLYGLVGLGGVLGGVFGSSVVRAWIKSLDTAHWLWICFGLGLFILAAAATAGARRPDGPTEAREFGGGPERSAADSPALEGARLALASPYLLSIAAVVGLYEIVSTILDFQFTATVEHHLDGEAIGRHFAGVYSLTNWISMGVQLVVTPLVLSRLGPGAALLALPAALLFASGGFLAVPVLWMGSLLSVGDNGLSYSINQSARETLYTAASREEKYKAKAFIDMFVQRAAKALAVGVSLLVTALFTDFAAIRWLSLVAVALCLLWIAVARYAGRRFAERAAPGGNAIRPSHVRARMVEAGERAG